MCTASIDFAHKNTCPLISERSPADGTLAAPFTSVGTSRWRLSNKLHRLPVCAEARDVEARDVEAIAVTAAQ